MTFIRNRLQHLSLAIIVLLVGSWISLLCQACEAAASESDNDSGYLIEEHCSSQGKHENQSPETGKTHDSCLGKCNCITTLNSVSTEISLTFISFTDFDMPEPGYVKISSFDTNQVTSIRNFHPPNTKSLSPVNT